MIHAFKRTVVMTVLQPGRALLITGTAFLILSLCLRSLVLDEIAFVCTLPVLFWHRYKSTPVGANFHVMPSMPFIDGKPYLYLYQKPQRGAKDIGCWELLASLIRDKNEINDKLPAGVYKAFTHEPALRVLEHCDRVHIMGQPKPLCADTLRHILKAQTKGRCKRCTNRCASWLAEPRMFYSVCFAVD